MHSEFQKKKIGRGGQGSLIRVEIFVKFSAKSKKKFHDFSEKFFAKFFGTKKNFEKIFRKFLKKKIAKIFFSISRNFFPVEIIYMMSRLGTQNFAIIGQRVPEF